MPGERRAETERIAWIREEGRPKRHLISPLPMDEQLKTDGSPADRPRWCSSRAPDGQLADAAAT